MTGRLIKRGVMRFTPEQLGWEYLYQGIWRLPNGDMYQLLKPDREAPPETSMAIVVIAFPREVTDGELAERVQVRRGLDREEEIA